MTVTLKSVLGQGGALLGDKSFPNDDLLDVLQAVAQNPIGNLNAYQATIAAATIGGMVCSGPGKIKGLRTAVGVCGTADSTTVQCHLNGVSQGELTTANTETDGTKKSLALDVSVVAGDVVSIVVSAAPTAGTDLIASVKLQPVIVE